MNINATLFVQMLVFIAFVAVTMKYIWPPVTRVLEARRKEIADGLAAADQGQRALALADEEKVRIVTEAKVQGAHILELAHRQAQQIIEEAKSQAQKESARLLELADQEIAQHYTAAKGELMREISAIAILLAGKVLEAEIDKSRNANLIHGVLEKMGRL